MSDPVKKFASLLHESVGSRIKGALSGLSSELGTITETGLQLDSFKHTIPDYFVGDWLTDLQLPAFTLTGTMTAPVDAEGNPIGEDAVSQRVRIDFDASKIEKVGMELKAGLAPGDRVLVLPLNGGRDPVVICKVVNAGG